jgi:hypothetical protein
MDSLKTKRHIFKFYVLVIFVFVLFSSTGAVLFRTSFETFQKGQIELKDYFLPLAAALLIFMAFYSVYAYRKNSPIITIEPFRESIDFGSESFDLKDIKEINLTGKIPFRYIITFPMEGASMVFNNGIKKFIYDDMYSNSWQLKKYIDQVVIKKIEFSETDTHQETKIDLRFENEELFKGNPLLSLRGISLWGLIGFFIGMMIFKTKSPPMGFLIFFFVFSTFWFLLHSWMMHYFGLTKDYFIVRNHNFFWMQRIYRINEIKEVVFETQPRQPNCLRIITIDFKHKIYPAGTLRDKTWLYLKDRLEAKGVTVRNECINDYH